VTKDEIIQMTLHTMGLDVTREDEVHRLSSRLP
jgi:hypothetical protein